MDQDMQVIQAQLDRQAQESVVAIERALRDESLTGKRLEVDLLASKLLIDDGYLERLRKLLPADRFFYKNHKANITGGVIVIGVRTEVAASDGIRSVLLELKETLKSLDDLLVGPPRLLFNND